MSENNPLGVAQSVSMQAALEPFANYQMVVVGFNGSLSKEDLKDCTWVAGFSIEGVQPEFRHFEAARAAIAAQPPAAPVTFQQSEPKSAATVETDHRGSSAGNEAAVEELAEFLCDEYEGEIGSFCSFNIRIKDRWRDLVRAMLARVPAEPQPTRVPDGDLEDRVVDAITEWVDETPPEHALAAAREAIAVVRAEQAMPEFRFGYTNWRGETSERRVTPISMRWGETQWHPRPGWLLLAFDLDKGENREFYMRDMLLVEPGDTLALSRPHGERGE